MMKADLLFVFNIVHRKLFPDTRCEYVPVRSAAASMRQTVSGNSFPCILIIRVGEGSGEEK